MKYQRIFIVSIVLLLFFPAVYSQGQVKHIGIPFIRNYERTEYQADQQNWMICEGNDGRIYFANNDGLLEFDGFNWQTYSLPNETVVRSIYCAEDGKIYAGGYNEFGYFEPDASGSLSFVSLQNQVETDQQNFGEVWRIHDTPDGLVFQTFSQVMILNDDKITVKKAPGIFHFSYFINGQLILVDKEEGLLRFSMGKFFPLVGTEKLKGYEIWAILSYGKDLLMATAESGIFLYDGNQLQPWETPAAEYLRQNQVFCATRLSPDYMAFGTIQNGLLICTREGIPVQKINRYRGLQNNTILSLKKDNFGNLWLGTDNGIDYIEINSPLSILSYESGLSAGYTAMLHNDLLYLGTNQGLFYKNWNDFLSPGNNEQFKIIENTRGQVWTLKVIDNELFCGHNNGTFLIEGSRALKISDVPGGWTYLQLPNNPDYVVGGSYFGLTLYKKEGNNWQFEKKIPGFNESSRTLEIDFDGSIWMSHGFKGVYHLYLTPEFDSVASVEFFNADDGFSSDFGIRVSKIRSTMIFTAPDGMYKYNYNTNRFEKDAFFNDIFPKTPINSMREDTEGNVWYFANENVGVYRVQEDGSFVDINLPFKQLKGRFIGGFEIVYPINESNVLFGIGEGFIHYNPDIKKDYQEPFSVFIHQVSVYQPDSVIFSGHQLQNDQAIPNLSFKKNAVYFAFAANDFENTENISFSTYLEGYDQDWTSWDHRHSREFTNLFEDEYTFYVKARNIYGFETEPVGYRFVVDPPWHRSTIAFLIYIFIGLFIVALIIYFVRRKIERSKMEEKKRQQQKFKQKEEKYERETLEAEKEIIRLRNEKLREQMVMKDKELANSTLEMIQKNKLLTRIKNDLKKIGVDSRDDEQKSRMQNLIKKINKELDTDKQWEVFETHFESVHEAFLKRLKAEFPDLSPRELKLCAYLRLNISSKEIAVLMNISTRGVEISRYRLRKKLNLQRTDNLTDFILSF